MKLIKNVHSDIYAKTIDINGVKSYGVSAFAHMLIVGIVCREYIKYLPSQFIDRYSLESFPLFAALHDLGKVSPGFQEMLKFFIGISNYTSIDSIQADYEIRHENVSAEHLLSFNGYENRIQNDAECISEIIRYHHGTKRSTLNISDNSSKFGTGNWVVMRDCIYSSLKTIFGSGSKFIDAFTGGKDILNTDVKYVSGLLGVCDWLGSNETYFPPEVFMGSELDIDLIADYANNAIRSSGLYVDTVHSGLGFSDIFPFKSNDLQLSFASVVDSSGLYVLEAPMGVGKTEAALYAAYNCLDRGIVRGVYFGLPTQTTSNSMFDRYKSFVSSITDYCENDIRLIHGNQTLVGTSNSGMRSWFHGNRTGILSSYGLGTMDQGLLSVLGNVKHFFIRTFGLSNKVVILDEVHSYDVYTSSLMKEFIDQLVSLDCVVIVLSATLTSSGRGKLTGCVDNLNQYPLITKVVGNSVSYHFSKVDITPKPINITHSLVESGERFLHSRENVIKSCLDRISRGEMVLWIENTVGEAQSIFARFEGELGNKCGLLHSRFTQGDRSFNEDKWVGMYGKGGTREIGCILVSTQVCEQSIDIDADFLVTALCPTDMLLQRIGRLQRHDFGKRCNAECVILSHTAYGSFSSDLHGGALLFEFRNLVQSGAYVYDPYILRRTYSVWKDLSKISIPNDIRHLLELTYDDVNVSGVDYEFKRLRDANIKIQTLDSLTSLSCVGGNSSDDVGNLIDDASTIYGTRRILQSTIDVMVVTKVLDGNKFQLVDGSTVTLKSRMEFDDRISINKNSVKVSDRFNTSPIIFSIDISGSLYYYCIENNGLLIDRSGSSTHSQYTNKLGIVL